MCAVSIPCTYESTRAVPVDTQWEIAHQTYHTLIVHVVATTRILSPSYTYIDCGPCVSHARKRLKKLPRNITRSLNTSKPHPKYCLQLLKILKENENAQLQTENVEKLS